MAILIELVVFLVIFPAKEVELADVLLRVACEREYEFYNVVDHIVYWFVIVYSVCIFHIVRLFNSSLR